MTPRIAANQQRRFLEFLATLRPHVARDTALPRRITERLARERAIGARDRRLYRELLFTTLRHWPWIEPLLDRDPAKAAKLTAWLAADLDDTRAYRRATCGDWPATPETLGEKADLLARLDPAARDLFQPPALLPAWFRPHCPDAFAPPQLDALLARARLWVRLQTAQPAVVLAEFAARGWSAQPVPGVPDALGITANADVGRTDAFRRGLVEIQDLGSQLILHHVPVIAGQRWLDACAGAGGKTLQLARLLGETGRVDAADIRPEPLEELRERGRRARLTNIHLPARTGEAYDGVLVDAPCSGSGTWRRSPHLKWTTTPESVAQHARRQVRLLRENAARVRPGGLLVYATCSLSRQENHEVVAAFLAHTPGFAAERPAREWRGAWDTLGTTLLPATHDSDGFYIAILRRAAT